MKATYLILAVFTALAWGVAIPEDAPKDTTVSKDKSPDPAVSKDKSPDPNVSKEGYPDPAVSKEGTPDPGVSKEGTPNPATEQLMVFNDDDIVAAYLVTGEKRYVSYGVLRRNTPPCSRRGNSFTNCQPHENGNEWQRGCKPSQKCRGKNEVP